MGRHFLILIVCLSCRPHPASPDASEAPIIPAAQADSEKAFPLVVHAQRDGDHERLRLEAGGGTALLDLRAPAAERQYR